MQLTQMLITLVISFALTVIVMPLCIGYFRMHKEGQTIRGEGPKWHAKKNGTPTMGGIVFLIAAVLVSLLVGFSIHQITANLLITIFITVLYGLLGFLDDFIKVSHKQNLGLKAWQKLLGQLIGGIIFLMVYFHEGGDYILNIGPFSINSSIIYIAFALFWLIGFSNAVNLTDGLDGLVAGLGIISYATYAIISYHQKQYDLLIICLAIIGALAGFLIFNHKPAKIFMGDVGSLALGGTLAALSLLLHREFSLLLIGFVYVAETASVILQVSYFRATGKRLFKMSPIHHHFEMLGWSEWRIDITFWAVGLLCSVIYLWLFL